MFVLFAHSASALASLRLLAFVVGDVSCPPRSVGVCFVFNVSHVPIRPSAITPHALPSIAFPLLLSVCLTMCYHIDHLPSFAECSYCTHHCTDASPARN